MTYTIEGGTLPVLLCQLDKGDVLISESGGRAWMRGPISTDTKSGGLGKSIGRMFSGESLFLSHYTAEGPSEIAFASSFPGSIYPVQLAAGQSIIAQKRAFMAATYGVDLSIHFQQRIGTGFFGGDGFIMQKVTGPGIVFLEIDGHAVSYDLQPGEKLVCDTGVVAAMDETCTMKVESVKGLKNIAFGGEGLFNTIVTGPGRVTVQTMPLSKIASMFAQG